MKTTSKREIVVKVQALVAALKTYADFLRGAFAPYFFMQIYKKVVIITIDISKRDAHELHKLGVPWGENGISHTHTSHKRYFLCESKRNLKLLNDVTKAKRV